MCDIINTLETGNYLSIMSEREKDFIKEFRKQVIGVFVGGVFIVLLTAVGFYFNTSYNIDSLSKGQSKLKSEVRELHYSKIDRQDYIREVDEMKTLLRDLNRKIDRIGERQ